MQVCIKYEYLTSVLYYLNPSLSSPYMQVCIKYEYLTSVLYYLNPSAHIASESDQMLNPHSVWEWLQINSFCNAFKSYGVYTTGAVRCYVGKRVNIYIRGMLRAWPIHIMTFDPPSQFKCMIIYMLDIYIWYDFECIWNYYHYITAKTIISLTWIQFLQYKLCWHNQQQNHG